MWIEKEEKKYYLDASKRRGLSLHFSPSLDKVTVDSISEFVSFLKKNYFFPIKVNIKFSDLNRFKDPDDGHVYYCVFFDNEGEKPKKYPEIYIASKVDKHHTIEEVYFYIAYMLTFYYQWFFFQEDRSSRSLAIEAGKWANYVCNLYMEGEKDN